MENKTHENIASSLIELIKEDRIEVREIRKRMYSTIQLFVIAAIVITAYGFENNKLGCGYLILADLILLYISWKYYRYTKDDLKMARKCLKGRQDQLTTLSMSKGCLKYKVAEYNKLYEEHNGSILKKVVTDEKLKELNERLSKIDAEHPNYITLYNAAIKDYNETRPQEDAENLKFLLTEEDYLNNLFLDHSLIKPDIDDNELSKIIKIALAIYIALIIFTLCKQFIP